MPNISERGVLMPPSPIRKLTPYADAAKKKGLKVYHLNIGQPDIEQLRNDCLIDRIAQCGGDEFV